MSTDDPASWVLPDPATALEFLLAGSIAGESLVRALEGGNAGDIDMWKGGVRAFEGMTLDQMTEVLGEPFPVVVSRTTTWVLENSDRIRAVALAFAESRRR